MTDDTGAEGIEFAYPGRDRTGLTFLIFGFGAVAVYLAANVYIVLLRHWAWLAILAIAAAAVLCALIVVIARAISACKLRLDSGGLVFVGVGYQLAAPWNAVSPRRDGLGRIILDLGEVRPIFAPWLGIMHAILATIGMVPPGAAAGLRGVPLYAFAPDWPNGTLAAAIARLAPSVMARDVSGAQLR